MTPLGEPDTTFSGDRKTHAQALVAAAGVALERGELERSEKRYETALSIQQAEGDEEIRAITLTRLAWIQYRRGDLDGAETAVEESLELVERLGLREQLPSTLAPWAYVALRRGKVEQAGRAYNVAVEICNPELAAGANLNLGSLLLKKGALTAIFQWSCEVVISGPTDAAITQPNSSGLP